MLPRPSLQYRRILPVLVAGFVAACAGLEERTAPEDVHADFLENLAAHCGEAFSGQVVHAPEDDPAFAGDPELVMHVRECSPEEVRIPVHLDGDRSRTWIFTRTGGGVDLRHDHRHEDGRPEAVTFYGAFVSEPPMSLEPPSASRHEFKFERDEMVVGWVVEIVPGERYVYGTQRDGQWRHRFDFDLTTPVPEPPDPWGHPPVGEVPELPPAQEAFWARLAEHCGQAFQGRIVRRPETDEIFNGDELLTVHFRACEPGRISLPFHVEENRSRTWVLARTTAGIDLRHDHRHEDGRPEANSWYGAHTVEQGSAVRQEFIRAALPATEEADEDATDAGSSDADAADTDPGRTGWAIEIVPRERYTYGTIRDGQWHYRLDFDLSAPVDPPAPPWGHEGEGSAAEDPPVDASRGASRSTAVRGYAEANYRHIFSEGQDTQILPLAVGVNIPLGSR